MSTAAAADGNVMEELFLKACSYVVGLDYIELAYQNIICEDCRDCTPGQTHHRCYWMSDMDIVREKMECALVNLPQKPWAVFTEMNRILQGDRNRFGSLTAEHVLQFFEKKFNRLSPLEEVVVRASWKNKVVGMALVDKQLEDEDPFTQEMNRRYEEGGFGGPSQQGLGGMGEEEETKFELSSPLRFSDELTRDIDYC